MSFYKLEDKFMIREPVYDLKKYNSIFSKNEDVDQNLINLLKDVNCNNKLNTFNQAAW